MASHWAPFANKIRQTWLKHRISTPRFCRELLEDGDIFFIDSTHTVKDRQRLPASLSARAPLPRSRCAHPNDIFLPFGMPIEWLRQQQIFWTEQYLLMALLLDNPRVRVRFSSAYHYAFHKDALERPMCGRWPAGGGSFWFDYQGRLPIRAA